METREKTIETKGRKLLLLAFQFVGISRRNGIQDNRSVVKLSYN
jgi:hypothetical protein